MRVHFDFGDGCGTQGFNLNALPVAGQRLFVSYARELRIEAEDPGYYTEDSLAAWRRVDGRWWIVTDIEHEVATTGHGITVRLRPAKGEERTDG